MSKEIAQVILFTIGWGLFPVALGKLWCIEATFLPYLISPIILTKVTVVFLEKNNHLKPIHTQRLIATLWVIIQIGVLLLIREWINQDLISEFEPYRRGADNLHPAFLFPLLFVAIFKSPIYFVALIAWGFVMIASVKLVMSADEEQD